MPKWKADPGARGRSSPGATSTRATSAQIVKLCIEKDGLGYQVFNAGKDDTSADLPTAELLEALLSERAGEAGDGRIRGAVLEPKDPRGAGLQARASLAEEANVGGRSRERDVPTLSADGGKQRGTLRFAHPTTRPAGPSSARPPASRTGCGRCRARGGRGRRASPPPRSGRARRRGCGPSRAPSTAGAR